MSDLYSLAWLEGVLDGSEVDGAAFPMLRDALSRRTPDDVVDVSVTDTTSTSRTYAVRMRRWREGEGPQCVDIEAFVSALEAADERARMFGLADGDWAYIGLMPLEEDVLIAVTAVAQGDRTNGR